MLPFGELEQLHTLAGYETPLNEISKKEMQ